jgi:hypothetical protein
MIGIEAMAITDHDQVKGFYEANEEAKNLDITVLRGVEISTFKYHILGYDLDIENKQLLEILDYSRKCQEGITKNRIEKISRIGVPITFDKVKSFFPNSRLGKGNILSTLIFDQECRRHIGYLGRKEVNRLYLAKGTVGGDIEVTPQLNEKEAIDIIHSAGGIAILAHPVLDVKEISELEELVKLGIDGLEIQPRHGNKNDSFKEYAQNNKMIVTYGSDFHGPEMITRPLLGRDGNLVNEFWR